MYFYLIIITVLFCMSFLQIGLVNRSESKKSIMFGYTLIMIFLALFAGLRYGIDTDYWVYYQMFHTGFAAKNIGFNFLISVSKFIFGNDFNLFVLIIALLSVLLKGYQFKKYKNPIVAAFIYFCFFYILMEFNVIRQGLAIALLFISAKYIKERRFIPFFILVCMGASIHPAALLFLPMYFINDKAINVKAVIILIIFMTIIRFAIFPVFTDISIQLHQHFKTGIMEFVTGHLEVYFTQGRNRIFTVGYFRKLITIFLFIFMNKKQTIVNFNFNAYFIGYLIYIMFMGNETLSVRTSLLYDVFMIPLFADYDLRLSEVKIPFIILIMVMGVMICVFTLSRSLSIPYQSYLMV